MDQEHNNFDALTLLSTPQYGPAIPNAFGTLILHTLSAYSFETHSSSEEIRLLDVESGKSSVVTDDESASEPTWLGIDDLFLFLKQQEDGKTSLMISDARDLSKIYEAGNFDGPVSGVKLQVSNDETIVFVVSGQANSSGGLHNPANDVMKHSSGRLYSSLPVRQFDSYVTEIRNSIFFGILKKINDCFKIELSSFSNALKALPGLECPLPPFGDSSQYDIGRRGIVFISKGTDANSATLPSSNVYLISFEASSSKGVSVPQEIKVPGLNGASSSPVFSLDGKSLVFLKMKKEDYESDKNRIVLVSDISAPEIVKEFFVSEDGRGSWDRSPSSVTWSNDSKILFLTAGEQGKVKLFKIDVDSDELPKSMTDEGCISSVQVSGNDETWLFLSGSTVTDSSRYTLLDPSSASAPKILHSISNPLVSSTQVSEVWYPSTDGQKIHAFVLTPPDFNPAKRYPLILLIHGGPQYAWQDDFAAQNMYSPLMYAAAGYVVFLPNVTGSTGYGQNFTDSIRGQWGGKPYFDLENGLEYIKENLKYVDTEKAVALGFSWGGYMVNWIAGQPLGKRFKALVSDSGIFSTKTFASATDEGWFPKHDFEGNWWGRGKKAIEKWDPSSFVANWTTPMMIIHNEKDYRHPISDGVAAFNALQERGIESAFLTFEDEGHMAVKPENMLVLYREILKFLGRFDGSKGVRAE